MRRIIAVVCLLLAAAVPAAAVELDHTLGNGVTDVTSAFNAAVADTCASTASRTLKVPAGKYRFAAPPAPIPCALNLVGEGPSVTYLIRSYAGQGAGAMFIDWVGGQDGYGGGSIRELMLVADVGTSGGIALWVRAHLETDPTVLSKNPHGLLVDNVMVNAAVVSSSVPQGSWAYGVYLDGSANVAPPAGVAPGIRYVRLRNVSVSRVSILSYLLYYAYGTNFVQVDCFVPLAANANAIYQLSSTSGTIITPSCLIQ